jgi:DNA polymerase elongation subunit (family B)
MSNSRELQDLVFGMNDLDKIVSIETKDDKLVVFREENGQIEELVDDNLFWVLTDEKVSSKQEELDGNQHYKYIAKFRTKKERDDVVGKLKKSGVDYYRIYDAKEQSLVFQGITYFKGLTPKDVSILSFDIETTGLLHNEDAKVLLISNTYRNGDKLVRKLFAYDEFKSQKHMIDEWCNWVRQVNPTIMCGHNIFGFDIPYLQFIARSSGTYLRLGRDNSTIQFDKWESAFRKDGSQDIDYTNAHIYGREIIDTMFLSYKYDFKREFESYGLKPIIKQLGLEKQGRTFVDGDTIRLKYKEPEPWALIKQYAIEDADDSLKLYDKMIPAYFYFNQSCSKTFQQIINSATGSQVNNIMVRGYLQINHSIAKGDESAEYVGAISFGIPGIYRNCFKQDVASLYPSIMRQYKIFNKQKDPFEHFIKILEYFTLERLSNKKLYEDTKDIKYEQLSDAQKLVINSMYGFLGTSHLNYNYPKGAAMVTEYGRDVLAKAVAFATSKPIEYWKELSDHE